MPAPSGKISISKMRKKITLFGFFEGKKIFSERNGLFSRRGTGLLFRSSPCSPLLSSMLWTPTVQQPSAAAKPAAKPATVKLPLVATKIQDYSGAPIYYSSHPSYSADHASTKKTTLPVGSGGDTPSYKPVLQESQDPRCSKPPCYHPTSPSYEPQGPNGFLALNNWSPIGYCGLTGVQQYAPSGQVHKNLRLQARPVTWGSVLRGRVSA